MLGHGSHISKLGPDHPAPPAPLPVPLDNCKRSLGERQMHSLRHQIGYGVVMTPGVLR